MNRKNRNILHTIIGVLVGLLFLFLTLRNKPLDRIWESITQAKWLYVFLTGAFLLVTFILRALRWRILIHNLGYDVKKRHIITSTVMGYFVNSFTPKLGEIVRCATLQKTTNVPLTRSFGSVVSERIYDILVLGVGLLVLFFLEFDRLIGLFNTYLENQSVDPKETFFEAYYLYFVVAFVILIAIGYFIISKGYHVKLKKILKEILVAIKQTLYLKKYRQFLILTVLIWIALITMNYFALKALPATEGKGWYFAVIVLFVGGIGWALPTPGGIGTTHYLIYQLFYIFNFDPNAGVSFGVLSNGLTFIYTLLIGFLVLFYFLLRRKEIVS
ncbi:MAG: lysylphosphatidylglycerol synthase transmembrane domain-containing protein [Bacteroidota bacterium]